MWFILGIVSFGYTNYAKVAISIWQCLLHIASLNLTAVNKSKTIRLPTVKPKSEKKTK